MALFSLFQKNRLLSDQDQSLILDSIRASEKQTSGEVRVYIESRCKFVNPLDRATEIFFGLKMDKTKERNAVLVYVAVKDQQLAIFGDQGIHQKTGEQFWVAEVGNMLRHFNKNDYGAGIAVAVNDIGQALHKHFPYNSATDKNELPDDIVFGK
jgi:uncharacterized membrane protein